MGTVHIKGRISTTHLRRGERAAVERTPTIDKMIERGYLVEEPCVCSEEEHADSPADVADVDAPEQEAGPAVPGRGASRAAWAEFLSGQDFSFESDATRDDLVAQWDAALADEAE